MNHVRMTVQDVIMEVFAMNTAACVSVALVFMVLHARISVRLRPGDPNVSQGSNNLKFRSDEFSDRLTIPDFSIFVTMMIITFFLHVDQNYFAFPIHMGVRVDLVGPDRNVTVHVRMSDMVLVVL